MSTVDRIRSWSAASLVTFGSAVIGLHILDAEVLQPEQGTSAGDHIVSAVVPIAVLALFAWSFPRVRASAGGILAVMLGLLTFGIGVAIPVFHTVSAGPSGDDYTGILATFGGLLLVVAGARTLWATRRQDERRWRRYSRRVLTTAAGLVVFVMVFAQIGMAYRSTHEPRSTIKAADLGAPYQEVSFTTSDGLELAGWYVPSRNGAAVIAYPGRSGPADHARMLIRHGYGVLMFDSRGKGESDGTPNTYGWGKEKDLLAALDFLTTRPDVEPGRIGGIGLSVGGEMLLHTAAESDKLAAVVSEGAGMRSYREGRHLDGSGTWGIMPALVGLTVAHAVFANEMPPPYLGDLVPKIAPRPVFLIYAKNGQGGEELSAKYAEAIGESAEVWRIDDAGHTQGLDAHPEEYERRVVGFFDRALLGD